MRALKIHFERRKSHKSRSGMQRFALTHILFPGGAALGCRRETSSLAGVDRVCAGIMRGRKKKKASESSTSAAHDSWKGELMVSPPKTDMKALCSTFDVRYLGGMDRIRERKRPKALLKYVSEEWWRHPEIITPQEWPLNLRYATI